MSNLHRGPLTDALLLVIQTGLTVINADLRVGDGVVPAGGGWVGQPDDPTSYFQPYVVLLPGPASQSAGPFDDPQADWVLRYLLASYSISRKAVEWMADEVRDLPATLKGQTYQLGANHHKVLWVNVDTIGGTDRNDATDPPYWQEMDGISIRLTKELT